MGRLGDISKLLVANRGEIACRVIKTARKLGIATVAVFSDADRHALHVKMADESFHIGGAAATASYLRGDVIVDVAVRAGAHAVHPGYGFLSENTDFAARCAAAGVKFVGPPAPAILAMGDKTMAKSMMEQAGVPVVPGYHGDSQDIDVLVHTAEQVGYPLLVKAAMGGGGKGMKLATGPHDVQEAILSAQREAASSFGDARVLLERFIQRPRHVEVQVFADDHDNVVWLYERDCSVQRRHQKIIEEAPAPGLHADLRQRFGEAAVAAARAVGYRNAGTVEFIMDTDTDEFFFMEMNTRLQVEHPVTEAVTGLDLVEWQLRVAAGEPLPLTQDQIPCIGHAFEGRLYAETPHNDFLPATGTVARWSLPPPTSTFEFTTGPGTNQIRVDSGVQQGDQVGVYYDPMIAKVLVTGPDRPTALQNLCAALSEMMVAGLPTNQDFMLRVAQHPAFQAGGVNTSFIVQHKEELMHTPVPSGVTVALAWLVGHAVALKKYTAAYPKTPGMGAWHLGDSMRLNHALTVGHTIQHPLSDATFLLQATVHKEGEIQLRVQQEGCTSIDTLHILSYELHDTHMAVVLNDDIINFHWSQHTQSAGRELVTDVWLGNGAARRWHQFITPLTLDWAHAAQGGPSGSGRVLAPMPGKVIKVDVADGDVVSEGQRLLVVEAMKMEHAVKAPRAGVVQGLATSLGSQVQEGDLLLVIPGDEDEEKGGKEA